MAPTLEDGTVTDANGISYTLQGRDLNEIFWLEPDHNGIMCGTLAGEWLIQASTLSDPITPTSIQAKRVTKYGCANIEPRRTGISLVFIQKFRRRVMEFLADVFTGRYVAPHLNEAAKHLTTNGVSEIGYQEELAPVLWARTGETTSVTTSTRTARTIAAACSIQSFVPGFTPTSGQTASIDWATNKFVANENSNTEVYKADMISGVTDVASTTVASLTSVANDGVGFSLVNDLKGGVYTYHGTAGNYFAPVLKITDALAFVYTHGSASAGGPPTTDGIGEFIGGAVASANADWLVTCEWSLLANHNIQVNRCDTGAYVVGNNSGGNNYLGLGNHAWYMDEFGTAANSPQVGAGAALAGGNLATAYVVGMLATNLGFYCVGIYDAVPSTPSWFIAKIGTLVPGDIDPDWAGLSFGDATNGLSAQGCAVDHFDNGIITNVAVGLATAYNAGTTYAAGAVVGDTVSKNYVSLVSSNTGHTPSSSPTFWRPVQMHYIMKYNTGPYSADGINNGTGGAAGVMWKVPVNTIVNQYGTGDQSLVKHGLFAFVEAHPTLASTSIAYIIDTLTGTYGTINIPGIAFNGSQAWDDTTNSIVFPGAFDTGVAGHPTALNSTTTYTGMWGRLYLGTTTNVPTGYNFTTTTTITPGGLIGATYRRVSAFTTEAPAFVGWHRHDLGHSRGPVSIGVTPSGDSSGLLDNLDMVTSDGSNYFVEGLTQLFDEDDALIDAWFVDGGVIPDSAYEDTVSVLGVRFTGLNWFIGKTIAVVAFGLDLGDYVVDANGTVFVPYGSGTAPVSFDYTVAGAGRYLFTAAYIAANLLTTPGRNGSIAYGNGYMPCCAGYTYTSQGQLLRPSSPETSGTRAGPAMGKKRRSHLFVGLFHNTIGVQVGTDFANKLLPANFKDDGDTLFPPDQMYSGTWRDTVESDYDFDSMITWQILRPYPASVVSIGAMLKTQDV
jgi:hypothetical protein